MPPIRVLITAGPTREPIDPVRYISNRSSGKMGYALAWEARKRKARVTLISGPVALPAPSGVKVHFVETAVQMARVVFREAKRADVIIMAAAVADYAPESPKSQKIKKKHPRLSLRLKRTLDILATLGQTKRSTQILVGFAAETRNLRLHARRKLKSKHLDYIVANQVGKRGTGFESNENAAILLGADGARHSFPRMSKRLLARKLLALILPKQ